MTCDRFLDGLSDLAFPIAGYHVVSLNLSADIWAKVNRQRQGRLRDWVWRWQGSMIKHLINLIIIIKSFRKWFGTTHHVVSWQYVHCDHSLLSTPLLASPQFKFPDPDFQSDFRIPDNHFQISNLCHVMFCHDSMGCLVLFLAQALVQLDHQTKIWKRGTIVNQVHCIADNRKLESFDIWYLIATDSLIWLIEIEY